jgi:hypothetical protein
MLDLVGAIVGMGTIAVCLVAFTHSVSGSLADRLRLAAIVGAWVGLASAAAAAGRLTVTSDDPIPWIGVLFAAPLIAVGVLTLNSKRVRTALVAVPLPLLIGLNSFRMLGVLFLFLTAAGRLSGPFPYFAGIGDIVTGALAIPLALRVARSSEPLVVAVRRWNIFGALDLVVAVSLGITSADGSPIQLIHAGVGSQAMQYLPYSLVPTVLVPFYLITHAIVAAQLAATRAVPALSRI